MVANENKKEKEKKGDEDSDIENSFVGLLHGEGIVDIDYSSKKKRRRKKKKKGNCAHLSPAFYWAKLKNYLVTRSFTIKSPLI